MDEPIYFKRRYFLNDINIKNVLNSGIYIEIAT